MIESDDFVRSLTNLIRSAPNFLAIYGIICILGFLLMNDYYYIC